jgi:holin-like protein
MHGPPHPGEVLADKVLAAGGLTVGEFARDSTMLAAITVLLVYQLVGEIAVVALRLPVPGPVVGMALLFVSLLMRGTASGDLHDTTSGLLRHLSLLFVPAGVGVMAHLGRLTDEWLPVSVSLVLSTLATVAVTALVMRALLARRQRGPRS